MLKVVNGRAKYHQPGNEFNGYYEDEITSAVFGSLSYMDIDIIWEIFNQLFGERFRDNNWPKLKPISINMLFWPKLSSENGLPDIFPDLIIDFRNQEGKTHRVILEVKWEAGAGRSEGKERDQLPRQWSYSIEKFSYEYTFHVYLVKRENKAHKEVESIFELGEDWFRKYRFDKNEWRKRLYILSWAQLSMILEDAIKHAIYPEIICSKIRLWAKDVIGFLDKIGVPKFTGFAMVDTSNAYKINKNILFWIDWLGFDKVIKVDFRLIQKTPVPLFWKE